MWDRACHFLFGDPARVVATIAAVGLWHLVFHALRARRKWERGSFVSPPTQPGIDWLEDAPTPRQDRDPRGDPFCRLNLAHREGRYEEAATIGIDLLRGRPLRPTREADVRRRLADALDGLGRGDEAEAQIRLAEAALEGAPRDASRAWQLGRLHAYRRDFAAACRASEEGLEVAPGRGGLRALLTRTLANDLFMAGRLEESARWAEEAIGLIDDPKDSLSTHRQAAASYGSLGRLDEGEEHARRAAELAEEWGDAKMLSDCLGFLAEFRRKRGRLAEALGAVDRAEGAGRPTRETELVRSEILRSLGRFDEALAALDRADGLDPMAMPRHERFVRGVHAFGRANLLMMLNRPDEAEAQLEAARASIGGDARVGLWCDAGDVHRAALRGLRDEAILGLDRVEARLIDFARDRGTRSAVLAGLGRAALAVGESGRAVGIWEEYLHLPAVPVDVPTAHYHLAEARRGLGDIDAARDHYREAVAAGPETHYARLAQSRLGTLAT